MASVAVISHQRLSISGSVGHLVRDQLQHHLHQAGVPAARTAEGCRGTNGQLLYLALQTAERLLQTRNERLVQRQIIEMVERVVKTSTQQDLNRVHPQNSA